MVYVFDTSEQRSEIMRCIKGKNTLPEVLLRKALWAKGIRYRINDKRLPGRPDIHIAKAKIAIFVDGEFWHGKNWELKKHKIKSNRDYWITKIEKNMIRDERVTIELESMGYNVIRLWAGDILTETDRCINEIVDVYSGAH